MPTFMTEDGRPLDDTEPQDIAREYGNVFEKLAEFFERGEWPDEEGRIEWAQQMRRAAVSARMWAEFGKWPEPSKAPLSSLKKYRDESTGLENEDGSDTSGESN